MPRLLTVAAALTLTGMAEPAQASIVTFTGTRTNVDAPGPAADRCAGSVTANVRNEPPTATSSGTSNFGSFTPTMSHCITLPLSTSSPNLFDLGEFLFTFEDGDTLFGTYSGELNFLSAGLYSVFQTHIVTGGTGTFLDASGTFTSTGTVSFLSGRPTVEQSFSGSLNVPAIPEPATWFMMLTGFMAMGARIRAARRVKAQTATA